MRAKTRGASKGQEPNAEAMVVDQDLAFSAIQCCVCRCILRAVARPCLDFVANVRSVILQHTAAVDVNLFFKKSRAFV